MDDLKDKIKKILLNWEADSINEFDVINEAEYLLEQNNYLYDFVENINHPNHILYQMLDYLEKLHLQLVIKEDIPVILAYLNTPENQVSEATKKWIYYWDNIDYAQRRAKLKYSPYK